jgi:hypothetical protein
MSQFTFLQAEFPDVFGDAARAETLAYADPRGAAFYCRLALETAVGWLYRHDSTLNGKPLAVVEAKRTRKDPRVGQQQAKLYADCLEAQYGQRPILAKLNALFASLQNRAFRGEL